MDPNQRRPELPLHSSWPEPETYVASLLEFVTTRPLFQNLCGGVHVLDFLTRQPDIYESVLPREWRDWVEEVDVHDLLHILLRTPTEKLLVSDDLCGVDGSSLGAVPVSLRQYIYQVRIHSLGRAFSPSQSTDKDGAGDPSMPRHISVGMKPKKIHEVANFAAFVSQVSGCVHSESGETTQATQSLRIVDFGSGQNYLGRTLASPPYDQHVIAIERKHHNVDGARGLDVHAKLAKKEKIMRNKKEYKRRLADLASSGILTPPPSDTDREIEVSVPATVLARLSLEDQLSNDISDSGLHQRGSMTHIEHDITSGELESIIYPTQNSLSTTERSPLMTVSLHSCGNLTHHALRSILNPSVRCVAAIGCCYNLLTERLGPPTYKHPQLHRSLHPRLVATSTSFDPQGFPMSQRLEDYTWETPSLPANNTPSTTESQPTTAQGIRMNITARMMAVQAPSNWGHDDSEMFFTRHFYRALLQKMLLDCGVVKQQQPSATAETGSNYNNADGNSLTGKDEHGTPLIVGSLRKGAFENFEAYVQAALGKLISGEEAQINGNTTATTNSSEPYPSIRAKTTHLTPALIHQYEQTHAHRRKHLAIMWSLMAFSAGVVESLIAVDRWLWLKEQDCVERAWVQTVFDYGLSPRNLCVVGIKKKEEEEKEK